MYAQSGTPSAVKPASYSLSKFTKQIWSSQLATSASSTLSYTASQMKSTASQMKKAYNRTSTSAKAQDLTPLMKAAIAGSSNDVWKHIRAGERANKSTADGVTPLMFAAFEGHLDVVRLLISQKADVNKEDVSGDTALLRACDQGHFETVRYLLDNNAQVNHQNSHGENALMYGVRYGNFALCQLLLDRDGEVNLSNVDGLTALMVAAERGNVDILNILLEAGAWLMARDNDGDSALRYAALGGSVDVCQLLINKGMDTDLPNNANRTPLMSAVYKGHVELVHMFTQWGANPNAKNKDGFTSIMYACDQGHVGIVKILLEAGAEAGDVTAENDSALSFACQDGHEDIVALLLSAGVSVDVANRRDQSTPLHAAVREGNVKICEMLLDKGAAIEARTADGDTPLMIAVQWAHAPVARLLLECGANVTEGNDRGNSAVTRISGCEDKEVKTMILKVVTFIDIINHFQKAIAKNTIKKDKVTKIFRLLANQNKVSTNIKRKYSKDIMKAARHHKRSYVRVTSRRLWAKWCQDAPEEDESSSESSSSSSDSDLEKEVCTDDVTSSTDSPDSQLSDLDTDSDYDSMTEENSFMATEIPQTPSIGTRVPGGAYVDPYTLGYAGDAPANDLSRTSTVGSGSGTPQPIAPVIRSISQGHDFPPVRAVPLSLKFGMEIFQRNDSQSQSIRTIQIKIRMAEGTPEFDVRENYVGRLLSKEPSVKKPFPKSMNGLYWKDFVVPGPPGDIDLLSPSELLCFYPLEDFRSALGTSLALGTQIAAAPVYNRQLRSVLLFGEPYECPSPISNILYTHGIDVIYYTHVPGKNL